MVSPIAVALLGAQAVSTIGGRLFGRKHARRAARQEVRGLRQAREQLALHREATQEQFERARALLPQRLAARGLLRSSIHEDEAARLDRQHQRAMQVLSMKEAQINSAIKAAKSRKRLARMQEIMGGLGDVAAFGAGVADNMSPAEAAQPLEKDVTAGWIKRLFGG